MSKVALWDLGNVVVQWNPDRIYQMLDLPPEKVELLKSQLFDSLWLELDRGATTEPEVAGQIAKQSGLTEQEVLHCFETVRESLVDFPRTIALIKQMKQLKIPQYVLSNMSLVNAAYLRRREVFDWFDGIVISAEEKLIKPDPELFHLVLQRYKLAAGDTVFIDDSPANIEAAQSLGILTVHFERSDQNYKEICDHFGLVE